MHLLYSILLCRKCFFLIDLQLKRLKEMLCISGVGSHGVFHLNKVHFFAPKFCMKLFQWDVHPSRVRLTLVNTADVSVHNFMC